MTASNSSRPAGWPGARPAREINPPAETPGLDDDSRPGPTRRGTWDQRGRPG
jgi:hypothetical protein